MRLRPARLIGAEELTRLAVEPANDASEVEGRRLAQVQRRAFVQRARQDALLVAHARDQDHAPSARCDAGWCRTAEPRPPAARSPRRACSQSAPISTASTRKQPGTR